MSSASDVTTATCPPSTSTGDAALAANPTTSPSSPQKEYGAPSPPVPGMTAVEKPEQGLSLTCHNDDEALFVSTADLNAAVDILTQHGRLIICGPPGSGKTYLADAVQKVFIRQGYTLKMGTESIADCHDLILVQQLTNHSPYICVEDGSLGIARCKRHGYTTCLNFLFNMQQLWDRPRPGPKDFSFFLIITVYPHIFRDLQRLDEGSLIPLADPKVVLHLTQDPLNPALPFTHDLRTYMYFLMTMMNDEYGRTVICALLALTMEGFANFLEDLPPIQAELERLDLRDVSCFQLAELADYLQGFIISEAGGSFVNRVVYDAAGLALGRSYSVNMALKVCDGQFLAQHVRMDPDAKTNSGYLVVLSNGGYQRQLVLLRMYKGIVEEGGVMELCQHPSLAYQDIVQEFAEFCSQRKNYTERVMSAVDTKHGLPLLYWSVWNSSTHLNCWCLAILKEDVRKTKILTEPLLKSLLASAFFAKSGDSTRVVTSDLIKKLAHLKFRPTGADLKLSLPVPTLRKEDAKVRLEQMRTRLQSGLCYLEDAGLSLPASLVTVTTAEDSLTVLMPSKCWYLLLRLLTDKQQDERDEKGNSVLHLAVEAGHDEVIKMMVKSGASLTVRNKKGMTPPHVARKNKQSAEKHATASESKPDDRKVHGDIDMVKCLLCQGASLGDKDDKGNTPLHIASLAGHTELVIVMLQLDADVNAHNLENRTPLHEASCSGHLQLARSLVERGAKVSARTHVGSTPLHLACCHGHTGVTALLIQHHADFNLKDLEGNTPLYLACHNGHTPTTSLLLKVGVDVNAKNGKDRRTALHAACQGGYGDLVTLLLHHQANISVKDGVGLSPADIVRQLALQGPAYDQLLSREAAS